MMDYSILRQELTEEIKSNPQARAAVEKMRNAIINKSATFKDVYQLADVLGDVTGKELEKSIASLGEEELAELAEQLINPVYRDMQNTVLSAGRSTQKVFNEVNGLGLNPAEVLSDESRLTNIGNRFREATKLDEVKFLAKPYVAKNIAKGAATDTVRKNADNLNRAGIKTVYVRDDGAGCCDWCSTMVGTYTQDNVPKDFWRVHKGCKCTFEYKTSGTHTKIKYGTDKDGKLRKETEDINESGKSASNSGIIKKSDKVIESLKEVPKNLLHINNAENNFEGKPLMKEF